jgi:hypothetical protein
VAADPDLARIRLPRETGIELCQPGKRVDHRLDILDPPRPVRGLQRFRHEAAGHVGLADAGLSEPGPGVGVRRTDDDEASLGPSGGQLAVGIRRAAAAMREHNHRERSPCRREGDVGRGLVSEPLSEAFRIISVRETATPGDATGGGPAAAQLAISANGRRAATIAPCTLISWPRLHTMRVESRRGRQASRSAAG